MPEQYQPEIGRVIRPKAKARSNYDRLSRWYDWLAGSGEWKLTEVGLRQLDVREGQTALEIGPGTGRGLSALAQAVGNSGRVCGLDLSSGMLEVARARIQKAGLAARVSLVQGDAASLPFRTGSFDAVFMSFTLELFDAPEIPVVLAECRRALRPGGRLGVVALSREGGRSLARVLYEWAHAALPSLVDCRPIFVRRALEEAGFAILDQTRATMWGLPVELVLTSN